MEEYFVIGGRHWKLLAASALAQAILREGVGRVSPLPSGGAIVSALHRRRPWGSHLVMSCIKTVILNHRSENWVRSMK